MSPEATKRPPNRRLYGFLGMLLLPLFVGLLLVGSGPTTVTSTLGTTLGSTVATSAVGAASPTTAASPTDAVTDSLPAPRDCTPYVPRGFRLTETDVLAAAVELSAAAYPCAQEVGLAPADDLQAAATLASAGVDGPLLLVGDGITDLVLAELERLAPDNLLVAGLEGEDISALSGYEVQFLHIDEQAVLVPPSSLVTDHFWLGAPPGPSPGLRIERPMPEETWLVAGDTAVGAVAVTAGNLGASLVVAEGDLRALPPTTRTLLSQSEELRLLSELDEQAAWQLEVVRHGAELPGGGLLMFDEDSPRRLVAIYGHPETSALGVLGEQDAHDSVERLSEIAAGYDADGARILPTFEIIATVASAEAGRDGDYSAATSRDVIRPWIEIAAQNGVYVVLDLQPGRTSFLNQAKIYEEFLREPHVGLALDPEWRLKPHQVHLTQIGTVDAREVNDVVAWLVGLVREEKLPQKLLIIHQFRRSMITNRELIEIPPELAVVIQMDGQGTQEVKHNTWDVLTKKTESSRLRWGWKNFYDEDHPTATPNQVLELTPVPVFVSYQ